MVIDQAPCNEPNEVSPDMEEIERLLDHSTYLVRLSADASRRADEATQRLRKALDAFAELNRQLPRSKSRT